MKYITYISCFGRYLSPSALRLTQRDNKPKIRGRQIGAGA